MSEPTKATLAENEIRLEDVRIVFPNLIEAKPVMRNGKAVGDPKYSVTHLLTEDQAKRAAGVLVAAAKAKWPNRDIKADIKSNEFNWPLVPGSKAKAAAEKKDKNGDFYEGATVLKADTKYPPMLVDEAKQEVDPRNPGADKVFYSGCYTHVVLAAHAYDGVSGGSDGVKVYLQAVMKAGDGERLIGRTASDVFAGIEGGASDEDPTGGVADDDIPF